MKRTWFPRFLSLLLTFVMLFELLPANVWATDAEADPAYTEPFSQDPAPEAHRMLPCLSLEKWRASAPRPRNTTASLTAATLR